METGSEYLNADREKANLKSEHTNVYTKIRIDESEYRICSFE